MIAAETESDSPDVVVIGAGPAGAMAALHLARSGRRVRLLERSRFPRDKICGCCLAAGGVRALRDAGMDDIVEAAAPLHAVTLGTRGGRIDLPFEGSIVIGRDRLDQGLVDHAAAAGVEIAFERTASVRPDGGVEVTVRNATSTELLKPRAIVVADGLAGGSLDRHEQFAWSIRRGGRFGVGTVVEDPGDAPPTGRLEMLADRFGYLGVVRLPDGRVDLAAAFRSPLVREAGGPGAAAATLLEIHGRPRLAATARAATWRGTPTLTRRRRTIALGRIACVGDAAGYVEPFTGEGMSWSLRGAADLARIVDEALAVGTSLEAWRRIHRRSLAAAHRRCRLVAWSLDHPDLVRRAATVVGWVPAGRAALARLVTGARAPRETPA